MSRPKMDIDPKIFLRYISEVEKNGGLGHFNHYNLSKTKGLSYLNFTRDFWTEAGVNQSVVFSKYLGNEQVIENISDAMEFIKPVLNRITSDLISQISTTNTELMLKKLIVLHKNTYTFYRQDRNLRIKYAKNNIYETILEENRMIATTLLDGISIMVENCVVLQDEGVKIQSKDVVDEYFDCELLLKVFLYTLLSKYYTILNLCKSDKNFKYCSGITINPEKNVPIEGIRQHPLMYTSILITGNQNLLVSDEIIRLKKLDTTSVGRGFQKGYEVNFSKVIKTFIKLKRVSKGDGITLISLEKLKKYITCRFSVFNSDKLIEHFTINKVNLQSYITDKEPYIFRIGCNKFRLDIRPIILLENGTVCFSKSILSRAIEAWMNYAVNGGRPYTGVDMGKGDYIIDGFGQLELKLGNILIDRVLEKLNKHYPNPKYSDSNVLYHEVFGKRKEFEDSEDYDIIYFNDDELFLIECKYFSDSLTANQIIGDYNKLFKEGKYYKHCRARYDLVKEEPEKMKAFIKATGDVRVHFLFVSSKPLEIEVQDEDKIVTFLSLNNFDMYIDGKLECEDGSIFRPVHVL